MNKQQRILVMAALASLAIVLHVWHYDYHTNHYPPSMRGGKQTTLLWWTYESEPYGANTTQRQWRLMVEAEDPPNNSMLWGIVAPIAVLGFGAFLFLGWRNSKPSAKEYGPF